MLSSRSAAPHSVPQPSSHPQPRARQPVRCASAGRQAAQPLEDFLLQLQGSIIQVLAHCQAVRQQSSRLSRAVQAAEALDGGGRSFRQDRWTRPPGSLSAGHGTTAVLEGGQLLEKAAVNTTIIEGRLSPGRAKAILARGQAAICPEGGQMYKAAALSLVFHPTHPFVPTLRADVRRFQVGGQTWFGGGCDLTPVYLFDEDARSFHSFWRRLCERHQRGLYEQLKAGCDAYFWLPARQEHRGIGGVFFDDLQDSGSFSAEQFAREVAEGILPSWQETAASRRRQPFSAEQRQWQLLRRGRYIEFNLLYDRGVKFGLDGGGRIESVMVSAPPLVAWQYDVQPAEGSEEHRLLEVLRKPRTWA